MTQVAPPWALGHDVTQGIRCFFAGCSHFECKTWGAMKSHLHRSHKKVMADYAGTPFFEMQRDEARKVDARRRESNSEKYGRAKKTARAKEQVPMELQPKPMPSASANPLTSSPPTIPAIKSETPVPCASPAEEQLPTADADQHSPTVVAESGIPGTCWVRRTVQQKQMLVRILFNAWIFKRV